MNPKLKMWLQFFLGVGIAATGLLLFMVWRAAFSFVVALLAVVLGLVVYFVPSIVAVKREPPHPQLLPIFLLNLFLGWTLLGWVGALVWSTTAYRVEVE